jgi:mono/diheme cytochrome c family protein
MSKFLRESAVSLVFVLAASACEDLPTDLGPVEQPNGGENVETAPIVHGPLTLDAGAPNPGAIDASQSTMLDSGIVEAPADAGPGHANDGFAAAYAVISTNCVTCHGAGKTLDMSTPQLAHDQLVGVEAKYKACATDGGIAKVRVVAGAPESSLLIEKIEGHPSCGKPMPSAMLLSADDVATLRAWVTAGAPSH